MRRGTRQRASRRAATASVADAQSALSTRQGADADVSAAPRREARNDSPHGGSRGRRDARGAMAAQGAPHSDAAPTLRAEEVAMIAEFSAGQPYPLDPFQVEAAQHLAAGRSVLVAAPTGTGKTVVAEFAIWQARRAGQRAIYTAPIKALSNQKFRDLRALYGVDVVGLMTGDIVENPAAPIVVMTTEIYRNMLLEGLRVARTTSASPAEEASALLNDVAARASGATGATGLAGLAGGRRDATRADADQTPLPQAADVVELARRARLDEELSSVGCVIFDELHYLNDPERGPVWEEAIIHSPPHVTFVGLSATVSNADELRHWIEEVHGPMALVYHDERAVPLEHYYFLDNTLHLAQDAAGRRVERFPGVGGEAKLARMRNRGRRFSFGGDRPTPTLTDLMLRRRADEAARSNRPDRDPRSAERGGARQTFGAAPGQAFNAAPGQGDADQEDEAPERVAPEASEVLSALRAANLLPCLYFLPGRRAVETAAQSAANHLLVSPEQRARLTEETQAWIKSLPPEDQRLDQAQRLLQLAPRGIGFHHAGLLPSLKVMVETLFARGELKAVFATDTLALGINMPARSVVVGSLSKFDGVQMRLMTPNEYQQLTGRAGRRGMDEKGAAVIPYSPWEPFESAFAALTGPLEPVTSAFTVRYNTVLNLWRADNQTRLRKAVAASLREYQRRAFLARGYGSLARRGVYGVPGGSGARRSQDDVRAYYEGDERAGKRKRRERDAALDPTRLSESAAAELNATIYVLRSFGYIGADDELTIRGRMLRAIFHPAGITLCELVLSGALDELGAAELAELFSWFTFDNDKSLRNLFSLTGALMQARRVVWRVLRAIQEFEDDEGIEMTPGIVDGFHGVALNWARGMALGGLLRKIDLAEGDLLVTLNQTIDLLQQVQSAVGQTLDARDLWERPAPDAGYERQRQNWRARLELLRPRLTEAWRSLLRGSVALSRAIPAMASPIPPEEGVGGEGDEDAALAHPPDALANGAIPATLPAAEDADPDEQRRDREEEPPES